MIIFHITLSEHVVDTYKNFLCALLLGQFKQVPIVYPPGRNNKKDRHVIPPYMEQCFRFFLVIAEI